MKKKKKKKEKRHGIWVLAQLTAAKTPLAPKAATPRPFPAAAPPPLPTARTAAMTMMPSPENARLGQSLHLNLRPPHLPTKNYPTPPPIVRKPWMWATMATQHPLLPKPLQPKPLTFPPLDPSSNLATPPSPPAGPSRHPLAGACHRYPPPKTLGLVPEMINKPCSPPRQGLAPATNLTLVQHNSLGSWDVFLSLFSSLTEGPPRHGPPPRPPLLQRVPP